MKYLLTGVITAFILVLAAGCGGESAEDANDAAAEAIEAANEAAAEALEAANEATEEALEAAEEACREKGLNLMVTGERYSGDAPAGYVLDQDPSPGEGLKGRRTVKDRSLVSVCQETGEF